MYGSVHGVHVTGKAGTVKRGAQSMVSSQRSQAQAKKRSRNATQASQVSRQTFVSARACVCCRCPSIDLFQGEKLFVLKCWFISIYCNVWW